MRQVSAAFLPVPGGGAIAHANHFLQWKEILYFKARGVTRYDFGGISLAPEGTRLAGIDAFKRNFGGTPVREFSCRRASRSEAAWPWVRPEPWQSARHWLGRHRGPAPATAPREDETHDVRHRRLGRTG